jgi:membrane-bound lytic murein transglycosylase D
LEIDSHPEKYFPGIRLNPPDSSQVVPVKNYTSLPALAKSLQVDATVLKQLNPSLMAPVWTGSKRIPSGFELRVPSTADPFEALKNLPSTAMASSQVQDQSHRVGPGETLSGIAAKYGTSTQTLAKLNGLRQPYHVVVGKVLKLPGAMVVSEAPMPEATQVERYTVKVGDSLSKIAERYSVSQSELMALNSLRNANQVRIGQQLLIRAAGVAPANASEPDELPISTATATRAEAVEPITEGEAEELGPTLLPGVQAAASADPADYAVTADNTIRVEAGESLSHYAQWLKSSSAILRSLNNLTASAQVQLGRQLKLDFAHVTVKDFEAQRFAFHQQMQQAFFERYRIVDSYVYEMKKGESIWWITQRANNVPVWLLRQYNPGVELYEVKPGTKLVIPHVRLIEG